MIQFVCSAKLTASVWRVQPRCDYCGGWVGRGRLGLAGGDGGGGSSSRWDGGPDGLAMRLRCVVWPVGRGFAAVVVWTDRASWLRCGWCWMHLRVALLSVGMVVALFGVSGHVLARQSASFVSMVVEAADYERLCRLWFNGGA